MASYNRVVLMGNLTRDIDLRYTPGGRAVTDIGIAVNDRRKNAEGEWVDETTFVDVTLWGRTAEVASEYLSKGSPIFIEGRLKLDSWEKDGKKNYKLRVIGERMQLISGREGSGGGGGGRRPAQGEASQGGPPPQSHRDDSGPPPGRGDAQPTGEGAGYEDADIPF
ncbi:single-stranded DNA-binding protein [Crateriforma conspicua]|uniref:Single-stranded DNA-binding protein n=1 Tax=Crateriforma conspicua TaxID=2527996 RepID=A0A5C5Y325_9PLAN|nr:single-stranded DNA-binding protein [Crateriforma conspicua]QDV64690.1 Single-stranded DNA-binding protein [Crateriforma conspicua]TWT70087.1 Single-stranded DNA-binding protein [Crateriforma conspicua]